MQLISQIIRNLVAGISQQPPNLRHPEQLEEQLNGLSTEASGLQKRPPTLHIGALYTTLTEVKPLIHFVKRDLNEKYCFVLTGAGVSIYDLEGNSKAVTYEGMAQSYLTTSNPRRDLKCLTIADYTFVTNVTKKVAMANDTGLDYYALQGALVNVKSGQYGRTYKVILNGVEKASFTTPDGSQASHTTQIDTNYIANQLATQLTTADYTVEVGESWLHIKDTGIATIQTKDGYNNQAMFGILKSVQKFSNLPATAPNNFVCRVSGEPSSYSDDYYVQYNAADAVWKECVQPALANQFDGMTMPYIIVRNADGSFTVKEATWAKRAAGDVDSNPVPSFVGQTINDVFFFRNRLGFVAGENVILSRSAEFFDFWMASAVEVLDTDMIDLAVSSDSVATLYHAVPFREELLLFSVDAQFVLKSDGALSPKNAVLNNLTKFSSSSSVKPVAAGKNIYFTAPRSQYTSVKEYFTALEDNSQKDAQDVTSHVPNYIPNGVYKIATSTIENIILFLTEGAEDTLYVYKYLFNDSVRQQSAWSSWNLKGTILGAEFIDSELYLIIKHGAKVYMEKVIFVTNTKDYASEPFRVYMDRKTITAPLTASYYNATENLTTIDLTAIYTDLETAEHGLVTPEGVFYRIPAGVTEVQFYGDYTGKQIVLGQLYNLHVVFSTLMIKKQDERGTMAYTEGRLQLRNMWLTYSDSTYFKVTVESDNKYDFVYEMTGKILDKTKIDYTESVTGIFKFPIQIQNSKCSITVDSDTPGAVTLTGGGWDAAYYRRSRQI